LRSLRLARFRDLALVPAIILLLIVGAVVDPVFLSQANITNVLQQQTELSLLVLAEAVILIGGKFDLSLESTIGLAPALALGLVIPVASNGLGPEWPTALAIPLCLLTGVLVGAFNGLLILRFKLSAFIVTLGMLIVLRGLQIGLTGGQNLFDIPPSVLYLGNAVWLGLPASIWICTVLFAAGIVALGFLRHGRAVYAIGGNVDAARAAGIRTDRVIWVVLIVAGLLAALAGLLMTGRLGSVAAAQGQGMIFTVFAAAVIGGVSLDGGKGTLFGALCGVVVLGLINNILTLAGVSAQWIQAIYGGIILIALILARLTSGKAQD
jgi:simple sugar transport system permease protein/ribose transport system permease protein